MQLRPPVIAGPPEALPAEPDPRMQDGHVWIPSGFGMACPSGPDGALEVQGVNLNEPSAATDRDPITGCPHHESTLCQLTPPGTDGRGTKSGVGERRFSGGG